MTFLIEGVGALILSTVFIPEFGLIKGIWFSIFHAISAFCNAGFDLMGTVSGPFTSITKYVNNVTVSLTVSALIVLGGIGFPVILDVVKNKKASKLNIHSKVVLITTLILIITGMMFILFIEYSNSKTLGNLSLKDKLLGSLFQSITARTAGFNTIDLSAMNQGSLFIMIILMFIGASPCSTGGGIKTTTIATIVLSVKSFIFEKEDIEVFERRVGMNAAKKSISIFFIGILVVIMGILLINLTQESFDLIDSAFEVASAFATVGSSIGGSPNLNLFGKILIMIYMFMGRVGFLTIFIALVAKSSTKKQVIRFPEGKIIVG